MDENKKFEKYKRIKNQIRFNYKGYFIDNIVALDLIVHIYHKRHFTIKSFMLFLAKSIIHDFFLSLNLYSLRISEPESILFSIGIYGRKDYYEIMDYAKSKVITPISIDFSNLKKKYIIRPSNIIRAISIVFQSKELDYLGKLILSSKISHYLNVIDEVESVQPEVEKYCAFNSALNYEALLTNYFNKKGIPSYTLQHAINPIYKRRIPFDAILYENFNTEYILCWGDFTKNEYVKYGIKEESLLAAGYPRNIARPERPASLNNKECLILLSGYYYHEVNLKVLNMLEGFLKREEVNVYLKSHPSLISQQLWDIYKDIAERNGWHVVSEHETLTELFKSKEFGWSVSVSSSSYYESFIYYVPCLRFRDSSFEDSVEVLDDCFEDIGEFYEKHNSIPFYNGKNLHLYFDEIDKRLEYILGISSDNYENYFLN